MFNNFYRGKRFLVTGVAGVKGSWLADFLLRAGAHVIGLDRYLPDRRSNFAASGLMGRIEFVHGDVTDVELVQSLVNQVDGVFHLAAVAIVYTALDSPFEAYRTNTLGVIAVLEAIRHAKHPVRAVFITTDKVYRSKNGERWVESDPLVASGPYAVSKACAEYAIADYRRSFFEFSGSSIGVGRAGNVLIGGDFHSSRSTGGGGRLFVDCFEALSEGRSPEIFCPDFTRPYTYGLDILAGYMSLMSQLDSDDVEGGAFNFGPWEQYGVPNKLLATKICELWGGGLTWHSGRPRTEPFEFQSLAIQKSRELLGWVPAYTIFEALRDTCHWYRTWANMGKAPAEGSMSEVNEELFEAHEEAARRLSVRWAVESRLEPCEQVTLVAAS